ncbi:MAG TPA: F0F1 ATP synthase subunit delta [Candidatus Woesebacteria bacterium]|nr:F0F1 ATP synthase subunit delta [Candidatus Woesebacteria bacterium]HNS94531.1 F0F1 ATP synthase subunit delta [Candidatus Woesebacteria bacterium]
MKLSKQVKDDLRSYLKSHIDSHVSKVQIIAPYELSMEEIALIKLKIPSIAKRDVEVVTDSTILAGFMIKDGSRLMDYSLKTKLQSLFGASNQI